MIYVVVFLALALLVGAWFAKREIDRLKFDLEYETSILKSEHAMELLDLRHDIYNLTDGYENEFLQYREKDTEQKEEIQRLKQLVLDMELGAELLYADIPPRP